MMIIQIDLVFKNHYELLMILKNKIHLKEDHKHHFIQNSLKTNSNLRNQILILIISNKEFHQVIKLDLEKDYNQLKVISNSTILNKPKLSLVLKI